MFSIPMNGSSEIHKDVKCFKREGECLESEQVNYHLIGDEPYEKQVCFFPFSFWLSFRSHEKEMKHRKDLVIAVYTGSCHWLSTNLMAHLSYKMLLPDPPFPVEWCILSCFPCMPHCRNFLVTMGPAPLKQEFSIFIALVVESFV